MGFALWIDEDVAWAEGTYEYRSMGAAVIARTDLFRVGDFRRDRRAPAAGGPAFVGNFASLGHINEYLGRTRRVRKSGMLPFVRRPPAT